MTSDKRDFKRKILYVSDFYSFDKEIINNSEKDLVWFRRDFDESIVNNEKSDKGLISAYAYPLLKELHEYYNDEICIPAALSLNLIKSEKARFEVKAFHFENLIFRLISFWDYYYNRINEYLQLGFITDKHILNQMIDSQCYDYFEKPCDDGKGIEIIPVPKPKKEQKVIRQKLWNEYKPKIINERNIKNALKTQFNLTERFKKIIKLMESPCVSDLRDIRNQIVHKMHLGAEVTLNYNNLTGQSISFNKGGWFDFNILSYQAEENLKVISEAMQVLYEVIALDERPNFTSSKGKHFFVYEVHCSNCNKTDRLPEILVNDPSKIMPCPFCWKHDLIVGEKIKTNEINYGHRLYMYIQKFTEHLKSLTSQQ